MKKHFTVEKIIVYLFVVIFGIFATNQSINAYKESLLVDGFQFSVDGSPWFIVSADEKDALDQFINDYQKVYLQNISSEATINDISFTQNVEITAIRTDANTLIPLADAEQMITANDKEAEYYTVAKGDSMWAIAENLGISFTTFVDLNPDIEPDKIWPGDQLLYSPADPKLDVQVKLESTVVEDIPYTTSYITDSSMYNSQYEVVTAGVNGQNEVTYNITMINGYASTSEIVSQVTLSVPTGRVVKVGTKKTLTISSSQNYGVVKGTLSSGYGWRTDPISGLRAFHNGIDIAASCGTSVYAYASGTVTDTGWDSTRGNYIIIDHGDGLTTRYLHLSAILVSEGDSVTTGEEIGEVGKTGYATGCHLHFGVFQDDEVQNPFDYL